MFESFIRPASAGSLPLRDSLGRVLAVDSVDGVVDVATDVLGTTFGCGLTVVASLLSVFDESPSKELPHAVDTRLAQITQYRLNTRCGAILPLDPPRLTKRCIRLLSVPQSAQLSHARILRVLFFGCGAKLLSHWNAYCRRDLRSKARTSHSASSTLRVVEFIANQISVHTFRLHTHHRTAIDEHRWRRVDA